jgi:hypothetical protein
VVTIMRLKRIVAVAVWGGSLVGCFAQDLVPSSPAQITLKIVRGSPFSAQVVTTSTQELADGNRIVHSSTETISRDSQGRTRSEESVSASRVVLIQDPIAGAAYILESNSRLVRRIATSYSETNAPLPEIRSGSAIPIIDSGSKAAPIDLKSESLGLQLIEGVLADGTRLTRTIPAGQSGNQRPVEVLTEIWYSTELQTIVMSRTLDPRLGETVYKLTNIQRTEPPHSLFEIPSDYTVRDEPQSTQR